MKTGFGRAFIIATVLAAIVVYRPLAGGMPSNDKIETYKKELIQADTEFNGMAQEKGIGPAFIHFAADDVVLMRQQKLPILGKKALSDLYAKVGRDLRLTWRPVKSDASASGDLGYTFGSWESVTVDKDGKETRGYGVYITVWKRQPDGSWRYVFDGGNDTPAPGIM